MNFDEFLSFRSIRIKDKDHERIVRIFFPHLQSVCGFSNALPKIISKILYRDLTEELIATGCFSGMTDNTSAPYGNPDFYIKFCNGVRIYVYGKKVKVKRIPLKENEYVLFVLSDNITTHIKRNANRHFYMTN